MARNKKAKAARKERDYAKIFLIAGVILSFLLFAFCVFSFIYKEIEITRFVQSALQSNTTNIDYIKEIQAYYRDASNYTLVSLIYAFIISVVAAFLGFIVERQKEKMNQYEKTIEAGQKELNSSLEKANIFVSQFELLDSLHVALLQATTINYLVCSKIGAEQVSQPITRLRDSFKHIRDIASNSPLRLKDIEPLEYLVALLVQQVESACDMCEQNRWKSFSADVGRELEQMCLDCWRLVEAAKI